MLGMENMRVKEHLIRNSVKITSWTQMREEILEITRTQKYIDSQPVPMQLGANPKSKGKGKDSKGKGKGKDVKGKGKAKNERIVQEGKERRSEKVLLLRQVRPGEGRVQKEIERPCRCGREAGDRAATSKRHSNGRAAAVLTSKRETHVDVHHSHALCEPRTNMRVFQWEISDVPRGDPWPRFRRVRHV